MRRQSLIGGLAALLISAGCASDTPTLATWDGPRAPATLTIQRIPDLPVEARLVQTPHYQIYTTIEDEEFLGQLGQLMEGSLAMYEALAPGTSVGKRPLQCYIFEKRSEWADFTQQRTGAASAIYLQIARGGYTIGDWYVAYFIGEGATCSVAAHEGWHQYVSRAFKGRLPPFLEEGLATTFEDVQFQGNLPRFNVAFNQDRALALRESVDRQALWPLPQVVCMHAGQVVDQPNERIAAFYAQAWAFARFLEAGEGGRYKPALQRLLTDTANGTVFDPTASARHKTMGFNPAGVRPMFEHYLGKPFSEITTEYNAYVIDVADHQANDVSEYAQ